MADVDKNILLTVDVDADKGEASTSKLASALGGLRGKLGDARKGLNETAEGLELNALAAGALAGVIGGTLVGAVAKFVEQDKKAAEATERLGEAFDELLFTLGNAVVGGDNFAQTTDKMAVAIGGLTEYVDQNRESIFEFSKQAVVGLTYVVEWVGKAGLGVVTFIQGVVDSVQFLVQQVLRFELFIGEKFGDLIGDKQGAQNLRDFRATVEADNPFAETERRAALIDDLGRGAQSVRDIFQGKGGTTAPVSSAAGRRRVGAGGGAAQAGDELTFTDAEGLADLFALQAEGALPGTLAGGAGGASIESVTQDVGQLVAATDTLTVSLDAGQTAGQRLTDSLAQGLDQLTSSAVALGVSLADALVTSLAQGEASLDAWVGTALQGIGQIALNFGQTAILAGLASQALPFLGLSGGAAVAAGSALVALGLGLKAGGAALASGGSAGGSGGAGGGIGAGAPTPPQLTQTRDRDTTIILEIDGQRVGAAIGPALEDMAQMGRLRLGRV